MKIISYDPAVHKLVPIEPNDEMQIVGTQAIRIETTPLNKIWTCNKVYRAMLAAVPDSLPGVVTHSGEPLAYAWYHRGMVNFDAQGDLSLLDDEKGTPIELFAHPAPDALSIIAATLNAAAKECARMTREGDKQASFAHDGVFVAAQAIRALSPQDILNSMEGK